MPPILKIVFQPINSGNSAMQTVFIQVVGAQGHYSVTPVVVNNTRAVDGYGYISIGIPKNIDDGSFDIKYLVRDASGSNSNAVTSTIYITNEVINCDNAYAEGEQGLTFTTVHLGSTAGKVSIYYDTYSVPDRIDIYQGKDWITGTGTNPNSLIPPMCNCSSPLPGFVGDNDYLTFNYNPARGQQITVVVSGCLGGGTYWEWELVEAPNCQ